jgi:hypothetical protein
MLRITYDRVGHTKDAGTHRQGLTKDESRLKRVGLCAPGIIIRPLDLGLVQDRQGHAGLHQKLENRDLF